eukprot:3929073-Amphidinium_carterae.2
MQPHTRWSNRSVRGQTCLPSFLVPMRAMENDVLKIFHFFSASDTRVTNLEGRVGTFLMPHTSKGNV